MATGVTRYGLAVLAALAMPPLAQAQEMSEHFERARTACAEQIESAFNALQTVCTAAVVIDLATTPDSPSCGVARSVIVEYVTACMEHASALLREGEPVELPPFPDLGPGIIVADGETGRQPAPRWWPWPFVLDFGQLPVAAAEMKHEALLGSLPAAMVGASVGGRDAPLDQEVGSPLESEPDGTTAPAGGAVQPGGGEQVGTSVGPEPDVEVGPPGRPISGEAVPGPETDGDAD